MNQTLPPDCFTGVGMRVKLMSSKLLKHRVPWTFLLLVSSVSILFGQQPSNPATAGVDVSRQDVMNLVRETENERSLDEQIREEILKLCDESLEALSASEGFSAGAIRYESNRESIPRLVESLEKQLLHATTDQDIEVPESASAEDVQQILQQAGAELASRRAAVQAIKESADERNLRRAEINREIAALNQRIYELDSSIESIIETASETLLRKATLTNLAARRRSAVEEVNALNAELINLNLRTPLRRLRRQRAERRVMEAVQRERHLEEILASKVNDEMEQNLSRLSLETAAAVNKYPGLKVLTDEILKITDQLFGPEGVENAAKPLTAELNASREAYRKTAQVMEVARNKYAALGDRADLQRWFPVIPPEVPPRNVLERRIEQRAVQLADANATLVGLRDRRANLPDFDGELASLLYSLGPAADESEELERQSLCRQLLVTRTELLDRLISRYADYYNKLKDLDAVSRALHNELRMGYEFTLERIFWRRSVSGPLLPRGSYILSAARWLFANQEWPGSLVRSFQGVVRNPWAAISGLVLLILLLSCRKLFEQRLTLNGKLANESEKPLRPLFESVILTFILAAPVPLLMAEFGLFLSAFQPAAVAEKFGGALFRLAFLAFGLELIVQIFRERGFAETQFEWSREQCGKISREVRLLMSILIPSSLIFLSFGGKASDHVGDPARIAHLESLGRVALIVSLSMVALTSLRLWRLLTRMRGGVYVRFHGGVLMVLAVACLVGALLSVYGWHLSAFVLALLVFRSFFLVFDVALISAFIERLRQIRLKVLRERHSQKLREQASENDEDTEEALAEAENIDMESTNRKVGESIRLGAMIATLLGLYMIWVGQLPSLRFLERVQLLPTVRILPMDFPAPSDLAIQSISTESPAAPDEEQAGLKTPGLPASPLTDMLVSASQSAKTTVADEATATGSGYSLTLSGLLGAIVILLFTMALAKYIPSLFDFIILSRFRIVSGDRKAITTVISYVLVIAGLSAIGAKLGLKWSQVQWLAAAFSFGLGFGLQDIFANFFSGIVLLFERPMRVGDLCRFGDQLGTVEAIGLRSTKIRSLDRTVINVPNADFSKKELVNYEKRDRVLLRTTLGLRYETTDEQLRYVLVKIRELLLSHPKVFEDPARVRFIGYGDYSLNMEIFAYIAAKDWSEFLGIQEDIFLRIMRIVKESGSGFAFPSQTTYLTRDGGLDSERTACVEAEVKAWRADKELPFPDFSERQRRRLRDSLDFPPTGSPFGGFSGRIGNVDNGGRDKEPSRPGHDTDKDKTS